MDMVTGPTGILAGMVSHARTAKAIADTSVKSDSTGESGSAASVTTYDFSRMTRNQMRDVSKQLYDSGQISFDAMTALQLAGPIGKAGPNGEFIPFSADERAAVDNTPMNYFKTAEDALAGIASRGGVNDPTSGYQTWLEVARVLGHAQGSVSKADITV